MHDIAQYLNVANPVIIAGFLIGATIPFLFSALTIRAVNKAAFNMIEEVRRQFREIPGLLEGNAKPDYYRCVDISTKFSLKQMVLPVSVGLIVHACIMVFLFDRESSFSCFAFGPKPGPDA